MLIAAGHQVTGMTRSEANAVALERAGAVAVVVDVFDAEALGEVVKNAKPDIVIHQLTDLPHVLDEAQLAASYPRNARIRIEGTRNLVAAAQHASAKRLIVQSVAFGYAPGAAPHTEADPLDVADGPRAVTVRAAADMERLVLACGMEAVVLRYAFFYGRGTWHEGPTRKPSVHIDAAARATVLALDAQPGIYNIADDDGLISIAKARRDLGFDPSFRFSA
jgi:nucleoside-diphosphate-sugar epimerase